MYTMKDDLLEGRGGGHGKEGYTLKHKRVLVAGLIEFMNSLVSIIGHQQTF